MKIDGRSNLDNASLQRLDRSATEGSKPAAAQKAGSGTVTGDRVALSADAELASKAVKIANETAELRTDLVDRMRKLVATGELGGDAEKLADSLIDVMLEQK